MRYYELIYIVNSNIERKKVDQIMKDIGSRLESTNSKIINHVVWGKKKLSYPIKGNTYGNYILLHYEGGDNKKLIEFDSWLKLSGLVIRHMIVKLEDKPDPVEKFDDEQSENDSEKNLSDQEKGNGKGSKSEVGKKIIDKEREVQ